MIEHHCLKIWPEFFRDVHSGKKTFEVRLDDRGYRVGDILVLQEFNPVEKRFTGEIMIRTVSYILSGEQFGIMAGYVVMGVETTP